MDIIDHGARRPFWKRLGWFGAIWLASVLGLAMVAGLIRLLLKP
jgi:hypothetical protein